MGSIVVRSVNVRVSGCVSGVCTQVLKSMDFLTIKCIHMSTNVVIHSFIVYLSMCVTKLDTALGIL